MHKKQQVEDLISKNQTQNRGPKSRRELANMQFEIHKVSLEAATPAEKREIERQRLISLGATAPKSHKNYKQVMEDRKQAKLDHEHKLNQMSEKDKRLLMQKEAKKKKQEQKKKEKGDKRFFQVSSTKGLKEGGMKVGKLTKNGMLKLSKVDLAKIKGS